MSASEAELRRLMLASLSGDAAAYRALLDALRSRLTPFFASRLGGGASEAEDLVQETLLAIHAKRATYDPGQPFTAWAYAIARYKLVDHFRRSGRRATVPLDNSGELFVEDHGSAVGARLDVDRLLDRLPKRSRKLIRDVKLKEQSVAETSLLTGMSPSAVKVAVHRALQQLKSTVSGRENADD